MQAKQNLSTGYSIDTVYLIEQTKEAFVKIVKNDGKEFWKKCKMPDLEDGWTGVYDEYGNDLFDLNIWLTYDKGAWKYCCQYASLIKAKETDEILIGDDYGNPHFEVIESFSLQDNEKEIIGDLIAEIKDKSLANILREILFSNKDAIKTIQKHRPELLICYI